jgi:hypothetical protein
MMQYCLSAGFLILLSACSFHPTPAVVEPVGPAPRVNPRVAHEGYLVVYSAWSSFVDQGFVGHHSRYTLSPDNGTPSREILNYVDRFDEGPIHLPLAPGSYHVTARSAHSGKVVVPVVIKERQTTFVYLDGSPHPEAPSNKEASAVKLPNGEIVGWSATQEATTAN